MKSVLLVILGSSITSVQLAAAIALIEPADRVAVIADTRDPMFSRISEDLPKINPALLSLREIPSSAAKRFASEPLLLTRHPHVRGIVSENKLALQRLKGVPVTRSGST
jgi:hypothetical protein